MSFVVVRAHLSFLLKQSDREGSGYATLQTTALRRAPKLRQTDTRIPLYTIQISSTMYLYVRSPTIPSGEEQESSNARTQPLVSSWGGGGDAARGARGWHA